MDEHAFNRMADDLEMKISMVDEFIDRAHEEGISTIEAIEMQNHVRREFSPKQRANYRRQIAGLYRSGKISIDQKKRMDGLLDKASKVADEHFIKLARIIPESQAITAPRGLPRFFNEDLGDSRAKRVMSWLGFKAS